MDTHAETAAHAAIAAIAAIADPVARLTAAMDVTAALRPLIRSLRADAVRELRQTMTLQEIADLVGRSAARVDQMSRGGR